MTAHLIELSYQPHFTLNLFEKLSSIQWSMLLYSGHNNHHPDARFDILVTNPILTLITQNKITTISYKNKITYNNRDPFLILQKYIDIFHIKSNPNYPIPFQGGFLGVFGYDLSKRIESLPELTKKDMFLPDMAIGLYRWAIITDHKTFKNYLVTHDDPNPILSWIKQHNTHKYKSNQSFELLTPWKTNISRSEYLKKFHTIHKHLINGNCYQICFSQRFHASYIGNEWVAFQYLLNYNKAPFSAFIRLPKKSSILSFSPERFIQLNKSHIKTQPIKGTLPKLKDKQQDKQQIKKLSQSIKNKSENLMIVDLLRNDFGKVAIPGSINVSKLFDIQTFPGVHHMVSIIEGQLDHNFKVCDLIRACFPGGSITGAPKIQAMKLIEELEPHCRNIWSGSIAYFSYCGNMDSNIIIRTLLAEKNHLFCSVGSGIVVDSDYQSEYQEMLNKISTLLTPLLKTFYLKSKI